MLASSSVAWWDAATVAGYAAGLADVAAESADVAVVVGVAGMADVAVEAS